MKIKNNSCGDIDLSKINLNCCDDEIVFIQEAAPIQSHFLDASIYLMQSRREGMIKSMGVDYNLVNPSVQVEYFFKDAIKPSIVIGDSKKETLEAALNRFKEQCKPELIKAANATGRNYHDLWLNVVPLILKFNPGITA